MVTTPGRRPLPLDPPSSALTELELEPVPLRSVSEPERPTLEPVPVLSFPAPPPRTPAWVYVLGTLTVLAGLSMLAMLVLLFTSGAGAR